MKTLTKFSVLAILALTCVSHSESTPLDFSFYITSRCGDTVNFINRQLTGVYQDFKEYLNIDFVPWGKSVRQPDGSVSCQFGPTDCAANILQSCALHHLNGDQNAQMDYISCEMTTLSSVTQDYTCVNRVGLDEGVVRSCADGDLGRVLEHENERRTSEIRMVFVPTIVYNHTYSADNQNSAFSNFRRFVCSLLENEPALCP